MSARDRIGAVHADDRAPIQVGPARVLEVLPDGRPRLQLLAGDCRRVVADWAIPFRYDPAAGDLLLTMSHGARAWVTGIVSGRGASRLTFAGEVELAADGELTASAAGGVRITAPEVVTEARVVECESEETVQRIDEMDTTVEQELEERAGSCERTIDGDDDQLAARHGTVARRRVKIDGELLRLS